MRLYSCGVPGHPPLTEDEQALPQFWDGRELVKEIAPASKVSLSNVDRILHRAYPANRVVLFEYKHDGEQLTKGQQYLHDVFYAPTLAEIWHVVYHSREEMRTAMGWCLQQA